MKFFIDTANIDEMIIRRNEVILWEGNRIRGALNQGLTLDELGLRAGDELFLPNDPALAGGGGMRPDQWFRIVSILLGIPFAVLGIARSF